MESLRDIMTQCIALLVERCQTVGVKTHGMAVTIVIPQLMLLSRNSSTERGDVAIE